MDPAHSITRYGCEWPPLTEILGIKAEVLRQLPEEYAAALYDYHIERLCLYYASIGRKVPGYQGLHCHGRIMSRFMWGDPAGMWYFEFNPNAEEIIQKFEEYRWLGVAGCKNSSKTESIVWLCLMFYLIDPENTKVLVGSKTLETAKGKIWASIELGWRQGSVFFGGEGNMPGELVSSQALIRSKAMGRKAGIEVIPGESSSIKKSAEKLQGYKAGGWDGRLMFATDETATMSHAIINTAISNLTGNKGFKGIGGFNPEDEHDPSRPLAEPVGGFDSITVEDEGWETKLGYCLHFDGLKSPNVVAGKNAKGEYPWRGIYTRENLKEDTEFYVEKSAQFWKMVRGFWSPTGAPDAIYSDPEIRSYKGHETVVNWAASPTPVAGLDPAFKHGGDRAVVYFGLCGRSAETGLKTLLLTEYVVLAESVDKDMSKDEQVAREFIKECNKRGVSRWNAAFDETGGGAPFGTLIRFLWGSDVLAVKFGGAASELVISSTEKVKEKDKDQEFRIITARDRYSNKVSELWHMGKPLLRAGQLKGLRPELAAEMVIRTYKESGGKIEVESKKKMKERTQKSPDIADSAFVCLFLCRERLGLESAEKAAKVLKPKPSRGEWDFSKLIPKAHQGMGLVAKKFDVSWKD